MDTQYAIVQAGGHQLKLAVGQSVTIDRQPQPAGEDIVFDRVLFVRTGETVQVGRPHVSGAQVVCTVRGHRRGPKLKVFKFRRRENYHRTIGHRSDLTDMVVKAIRV